MVDSGLAVISIDPVLSGDRNQRRQPGVRLLQLREPTTVAQQHGPGRRRQLLHRPPDPGSFLHRAAHRHRSRPHDPLRPGEHLALRSLARGATGAPFLAFDPDVKAAVLSGTGALLFLGLLGKTLPIDISAIVATYIPDQSARRIQSDAGDGADLGGTCRVRQLRPADRARAGHRRRRAEAGAQGRLSERGDRRSLGAESRHRGDGDRARRQPDPLDRQRKALARRQGTGAARARAARGAGERQPRGQDRRPRPVSAGPGSDGHFVASDVSAAVWAWSQFLETRARTGTATLPF